MLASEAAHSGPDLAAALKLPRLRLLFGLAASLASIAAFATVIDLSEMGTALKVIPREPATVGLVALAYSTAFGLRAIAWRLLLSTPLSSVRLLAILQVSLFLNHLLPLKAGEVARPYLASRHGIPLAEATATTLVARLLDLAVLAAIALVALPVVAGSDEVGLGFLASAALITGACVALLLLRSDALPLPGRLRALDRARDSLRQISLVRLGLATPLVVLSWLLEGGVLLGAAHFLGVEVSLQTAVGATAFTILFQVVHFTPGGLGVYETSMTSVLALQGVPAEQGLALAVLAHGLKFAYSFTVGLAFTAAEAVSLVRQRSDQPRQASRFEIVSARLWNVINEGKPFTPVFFVFVAGLLSLPHVADTSYWPRAGLALLALTPLLLVFWRFDFPLHLRRALWLFLAAFVLVFQTFALLPVLLVVVLYLTFTVLVWGTVYYHLRIGTAWSNGLRFWRLVLENPDPTSGNLQEQLPKVLMLVMAFELLVGQSTLGAVLAVEAFTAVLAVAALLVHQWWFTWVPALPQPRSNSTKAAPERISKRVIAIVIDGCRADRLDEANTPCIDRLRAEGTIFTDLHTVYPARTVTCFSSMFTGAAPATHGMRSNFVPSLGVKCESIFDALRRAGLKGKLVGIAHLIDAFGDDVASVTAVMHNDEIDDALVERAKRVMLEDDPELLVLQLLSVDQTGHARGSYYPEYLRKIEVTDTKIEAFLAWCEARGYLEDATVLITADHGQGIGIGGHGHMSPPEIHVPGIFWGKGVAAGVTVDRPAFVTDVTPTICDLLGAPTPRESVGEALLPLPAESAREPLVYVIPAFNEAQNLPAVLAAISATAPAGHEVVVVDDGSADNTAAVAASVGAVVVRHESNRGLGAALRSGFARARELNARAVVYLDADGEYDPVEAARLLAPIERGEADYVLGSRFRRATGLRVKGPEGMTLSRRVANRCFSLALSALCGRWVSDGQTGYRALSRRALDVAEIVHDYNYAQVLTLDLLHKGMRMAAVPVSYRRRRQGRSFINAQYLWRVPLGMAREVLGE